MKQKKKDFKEKYIEDAFKGMHNISVLILGITMFIIAFPFYLFQQIVKLLGKLKELEWN